MLGNNIGPIAQLVEHSADNAGVSGSIPLGPTINNGLKKYKINCFFKIAL